MIFSKTNIINDNNLQCLDQRLAQCGGIILPNIAFGDVNNLNSGLNYITGALMMRQPNSTIRFVDRQIENAIKLKRYFDNVTSFINGFFIDYYDMKSENLILIKNINLKETE